MKLYFGKSSIFLYWILSLLLSSYWPDDMMALWFFLETSGISSGQYSQPAVFPVHLLWLTTALLTTHSGPGSVIGTPHDYLIWYPQKPQILLLFPFCRKRNWGLEIGILAMPLLLKILETFNFLKGLFSCGGTKTFIQLESLPLRERVFSLPPHNLSLPSLQLLYF